MIVKIKGSFEAAHFLPEYRGSCNHLHGHTYHYVFNFKGETEANGMVIDFKILEQIVKAVIEKYDHQLLNEFIPNPTAENIAQSIFDIFKKYNTLNDKINLKSLELWETDKYGVEVSD